MIIWSGFGFAVAVYAVLGFICGGLLGNMIETDESWPFALGLFAAAAANHFTAARLDASPKEFVDPDSGETALLQRSDSLFWIPMRYWTYAIAALGALMLIS